MILTHRPYYLELTHTFTVSGHSRSATPVVLVKIEHDGITGYGEASLPPYLGETTESVTSFLNKVDLSGFKDLLQLEDILAFIDRIDSGNTAAKASLDIALHDLVGKCLGVPWYKIWGLNREKTPSTTYTIGIDTPEKMKEKVKEVDGLFNLLKIKVGTPDDKEIVKAIREVTSLPLTVDANQGWKDRYKALDMINWLQEEGVILVEQPMPKEQLDDIAWLTQHTRIPIIADESVQRLEDVLKVKKAFDGINIKLMKCTGMREAWKMVQLARSLDMKVMLGCMTETSCAISAAAQLSPAVDFADLDGNLLISNDIFDGVKIKNGKIHLNDWPGIGVREQNGKISK